MSHSVESSMRLRGDGVNVNRYRASRANTEVHLYLDVNGQQTVADLLVAIAETGARPEDVSFRGGCFVVTIPATVEDVARWELADAEQEAGRQKSRRDAYERLRAEFEGVNGS